ncbi:MAG: hypothetical protein NTW14_01755 [bacterium]|nr:hypothetical protein [bacterium]
MRNLTSAAICLIIVLGMVSPCLSETGSGKGEFICDKFEKDAPAVFWNVVNQDNLFKIKQGNGVVEIKGSAAKQIYAAYEFAVNFPPRDFWISVDAKIAKGSTGGFSLGVRTTYPDWENPLQRDFFINLDRGWNATIYNAQLPKPQRYHAPTINTHKNPIGDEDKNFHTMKIAYNSQTKTMSAYLDELLLGEEVIDWNLDKGLNFRFWTWCGDNEKRKIDVFFSNFQSNLPWDLLH